MVENRRPTDTELLLLSVPFEVTDRERSDSFTELLKSGLDWSCLEEKLINCRLYGFFLRNANNANVSHLIPGHIREHFSALMKKDLVNNLLYLEEFKELAGIFKKNSIDFIVLKGMALYFTVYATSRFRFMFDIDLLVRETQYEEAKRVLGYKDQEGLPRAPQDFDVFQQFGYIKNTKLKQVQIDIHRALIKGARYGYFKQENLWRDSMLLEAGTLTMRILSPETQLMHLCANLVKNIHSKQSYLVSFCDIVETIRFYDKDFKWESFIKLLREERVEREIYSVLSWLCKKRFIRLPAIMEERLKPFFRWDILEERDIFGFKEYSDTKFRWHLISNVPGLIGKAHLIYNYIFPSRQELKAAYPNIHSGIIYFCYWYRIIRRIFRIIGFSICKLFYVAR